MKKNMSLIFGIVLVLSFSFVGCDEQCTESETEIYGSWLRTITDDEGIVFDAELKITSDSYDFIVLTANSGHSNSYAEISISDNKILITSDQDCLSLGEKAEYEYLLTENKLSLIAVSDSCYPRVKAIQGIWDRKKN